MADLKERYASYFGDDNLVAQELINQYNNESAEKQMQFQAYMSDTAHRREVNDLIQAGLNPVLSANAGAPAMVGAYSNVDSAPVSAGQTRKLQMDLQKNDLENARIMNKYSTDVQAQVGRYQARVGAAATKAAAAMSAGAALAAANISAGAAKYNSDNQLLNAREQRAWDSMHPSNPYQAGGSVLEWLTNGGPKISAGQQYGVGNSTAK